MKPSKVNVPVISVKMPTSRNMNTKLRCLTALCTLVAQVTAQARYAPMTPPQDQPITEFPIMGFGTAGISSSQAPSVIASAMAKGFRSIDTAMIYGNEVGVGQGIARGLKETGLKRENIWVTTKVILPISMSLEES
jgi:hypothetical protein